MTEMTLRIAQLSEVPSLPRTEEEIRRAAVLQGVVEACGESGTFSVTEGNSHQAYSLRKLPSGNYHIAPQGYSHTDLTPSESFEPADILSFQKVYQERGTSSVTITPDGRIVSPHLDDPTLQARHAKLVKQIDHALERRHDGIISELIG
jgi:hypothetical protein